MLYYRGITPADLFSSELLSSGWGRALWAKILLVLTLVAFQVIIGHRPSKVIYGYILVSFAIVGISVVLVRPVFL